MLTTAYRHGETAALAPLDFLREHLEQQLPQGVIVSASVPNVSSVDMTATVAKPAIQTSESAGM